MKKIQVYIWLLLFCMFTAAVWGQEGKFKTIGQMPTAVSGAKAVVRDSLVYLLGGSSNVPFHGTRIIQEYTIKNGWWRVREEQLVGGRTEFFAAKMGDSIIYLGGCDSPQNNFRFGMELWDFRNPPFVSRVNTNFSRSIGSGVLYKRSIILIGGEPSRDDTADFHYLAEYDLAADNIKYTFDSVFSDGNFLSSQMCALIDSSIYIFGGLRQNQLLVSSIARYDIYTRKFKTFPLSMLQTKILGAAVYLGSRKIMIIGGRNSSSLALSSTEIYDFSTSTPTVKTGPTLNVARSEPAVAVVGRSLYVFGGMGTNGKPVNSVERLDSIVDVYRESRPAVSFALSDNYPNPFNPSTRFSFEISQPSDVKVEVFSLLGSRVKTLAGGYYHAGVYTVEWDGRNSENIEVPSGIYLYRLAAAGFIQTKKMILLR